MRDTPTHLTVTPTTVRRRTVTPRSAPEALLHARGDADAFGAVTTPATTRARRHVPELDGVRGLAIVLVMALHFVNNQVVPTSTLERIAIKVVELRAVGRRPLLRPVGVLDYRHPGRRARTPWLFRQLLRPALAAHLPALLRRAAGPHRARAGVALAAIDPELLGVRERSGRGCGSTSPTSIWLRRPPSRFPTSATSGRWRSKSTSIWCGRS